MLRGKIEGLHMAQVLDRLTALKAPIDMVRRHGAGEFHRTSMEEFDKAEYLLEKLQRVLEEVRCPPDQRLSCPVSLFQSEAYDWLKLVLKCSRIPDVMPCDFFIQDFRAKYVIFNLQTIHLHCFYNTPNPK